MSSSALAAGIRHLRGKMAMQCRSEESDEQLLHAFTAAHDEDAFSVLVRRHGPMVLHVCRRVLGHEQDAEDAFQATFLMLARSAADLRKKTALAGFLHGVAYRIALTAKRSAARRRKHESQAPPRAATDPSDELSWREVRTLLDEEIARLPEIYRSVFVLCCLENLSRAETAQRLGLKERTVLSRLAEARKRLGQRLGRRGVELTAVLAATTVATQTALALPATLMAKTIEAAMATAAGQGLAGVVSASVAELVKSTTAAGMLSKAKIAAVVLLAASLLTVATSGSLVGWYRLASGPLAATLEPTAAKAGDKPNAATPKPEKAKTVTIQGRVLDPEGKPKAGAKLLLLGGGDKPQKLGVTAADGGFRIAIPKETKGGDLIAQADGFGIDFLNLAKWKTGEVVELRLVKDRVIRGRVVNTEGKPVAGITVVVVNIMAFERLDDFLRAFQRQRRHADEGTGARRLQVPLSGVLRVKPTDKDGRFEIQGVGVERLVGIEVKNAALAEDSMLVVTREDFDAKAYLKKLLPDGRERMPLLFGPSFEYVAERARFLEGTVHEVGNGKPVAGATVAVFGISTLTDAEGHYRLAGMRKAPEYFVQVSAPEKEPLIGCWRRVKASAAPSTEPMRVDVELMRGNVVAGRVFDKTTGKGVPSLVHFVPLPENKTPKTEELNLSVLTGTDGRFRLATIPGPGVLLASVPGNFLKIDGVPIQPYKQAEFDAADRPRIKMNDRSDPHRAFLSAGGMQYLEGHHACKVLDVKTGGAAVSCDLALDPGKTLRVNLRDAQGKPVAGVVVMGISAQTKQAVPLPSAACTIYTLDPAQPRPVVFLHAERKLAALVTLHGDEKEPATVRLAPAGELTGRVLDEDGQPVAGAEILVFYTMPEGMNRPAFLLRDILPRTDKEGRFRLDAVVPGLKVNLGFLKGRQRLPIPPLNIKPLESGQKFDFGNIRIKPPR